MTFNREKEQIVDLIGQRRQNKKKASPAVISFISITLTSSASMYAIYLHDKYESLKIELIC